MPYRVERATSTRASADPDSPDFQRWVHWLDGDVVAEFPEHVSVPELLESGAVTETDEQQPAPARRRKGRG